MKIKRHVFVIMLGSFFAPSAVLHAQSNGRSDVRGGLSVLDLGSVDPDRIDRVFTQATTVELSDEARKAPLQEVLSRAAQDAGTSLVSAVAIRPYLLQPTAPADATGPVIGAVPPHIRHVSLTLQGERFILDVVESEVDPSFGFRHVSAVVVNHSPRSYARFTVDDRAGLITGTVRTDGKTYRIVPSDIKGTQLVYAIDSSDQSGMPRRYRPIEMSSASQVEKRHIQAEMAADLRVSTYSDDGFLVRLRSTAGLGFIDPRMAREPEELRRLLSTLAPLTGGKGDEEFQILSVQTPGREQDHYVISYQQMIAGLPVSNPRELSLSKDGAVLSLEATLLDPTDLPDATNRMSDRAAFETAAKALELEYGASGAFMYEHIEEQESVAIRPVNGEWLPIWRSLFSVSSNSHSGGYWVSVNLLNGEAIISSADRRH